MFTGIVSAIGTITRTQPLGATADFGQRNLEWTWIKNTPRALLLTSAAAHLLYSLAGVIHYARVGRGGAALRAKYAALRGLPGALADRRRIQAARTVETPALTRHMEPRWIAAKRREKAFDAARRKGLQAVRDPPVSDQTTSIVSN